MKLASEMKTVDLDMLVLAGAGLTLLAILFLRRK